MPHKPTIEPTKAPAVVIGGTTYGSSNIHNGVVTVSNSLFSIPSVVIIEVHTTRTENIGDVIASIMGYNKHSNTLGENGATNSATSDSYGSNDGSSQDGSANTAGISIINTNNNVTTAVTNSVNSQAGGSGSVSTSVTTNSISATATKNVITTVAVAIQTAGADKVFSLALTAWILGLGTLWVVTL